MALTHFDGKGAAHMVDVSEKEVTSRTAIAVGYIKMSSQTLDMITQGSAKKGDVLGVARLAGIMGAKRTADLIPLCHPLPVTKVAVDLTPDPSLPGIRIEATVNHRPDRRRDGSVDGRLDRCTDSLRYGESRPEGHGDR